MSQEQRLLTMHAMLDYVATEAGKGGETMASLLAAAADKAILDQIAKANPLFSGKNASTT
jgi:hypothetical protein